jgi:mRNA interferase RelE/StbE
MDIRYTAKAAKDLRKIGPRSSLIIFKIEQYAADPMSLRNNVKRLTDRGEYRLRVGDYCVLFTIEGDLVKIMLIQAVGHRRKIYG